MAESSILEALLASIKAADIISSYVYRPHEMHWVLLTADGRTVRIAPDDLAYDFNDAIRQIFKLIIPSVKDTAIGPKANAARIKAINDELDICRGVVPTPMDYVVDPKRVKELMVELREQLYGSAGQA